MFVAYYKMFGDLENAWKNVEVKHEVWCLVTLCYMLGASRHIRASPHPPGVEEASRASQSALRMHRGYLPPDEEAQTEELALKTLGFKTAERVPFMAW